MRAGVLAKNIYAVLPTNLCVDVAMKDSRHRRGRRDLLHITEHIRAGLWPHMERCHFLGRPILHSFAAIIGVVRVGTARRHRTIMLRTIGTGPRLLILTRYTGTAKNTPRVHLVKNQKTAAIAQRPNAGLGDGKFHLKPRAIILK